ncbi:MAG: phosphoribosylanthranilate isomerase [Planctomycetes bacterium]|nr:phosphoribosylanthranilate isomerase [Planctomycetota bacterium]MBL7107289.1 phosphoribosylanthranilate isomerase [Phycisphaerae bacterium]
MVKVKICGITNYEDAQAAIDMGADILGFNFYKKSPRYITPEAAAGIICKFPAYVQVAGVFVNSSFDEINKIMSTCQLNWIQFHGDETTEFCDSFLSVDVKTMKAIRVKDQSNVEMAKDYSTDAILLDAYDSGKYGGTGISFDWNVVGNITQRIFLAGGINPSNAAKAVELGVYGIDVCSGIESSPGKKDYKKMQELFDNISHLRG